MVTRTLPTESEEKEEENDGWLKKQECLVMQTFLLVNTLQFGARNDPFQRAQLETPKCTWHCCVNRWAQMAPSQ